MTHDSAVRTVVNLLPEIEKSGAEVALADYAREQDLPPAQLEKLAQVLNTLRTVSHIDNAEESERGATVSLVDVPELVVGYATHLDQEKEAARPESINSHDVRTIDLNAMLHSDIFGVEKAASAEEEDTQEEEEPEKLIASIADFNDALVELEVDLDDDMAKAASEILAAAPEIDKNVCDISEFEKEALYFRNEEHVKAAGDYMEKFADAYRIKIVRHEYDEAPIERAYDIEHTFGKKFGELAKAASELAEVKKMAASDLTEDEMALLELYPSDNDPDRTQAEPHPEDSGETIGNGGGPSEEELEGVQSGLEESNEPGAQSSRTGGEGQGQGDNNSSPKQNNKKDSPKSSRGGSSGGVDGVGILAAPFKAVGEGIQGAAQAFDERLNRVTSKERFNKAQRDTDVSVEDIKRAIGVKRLIAGDQVLREHDPKEVLEIYNAIAERNPEIASNPTALRLILREAVSYEGLTLDAQKQLSDIRKNTAQGEQAENENEKKRYSAGGALPIGGSSSKK